MSSGAIGGKLDLNALAQLSGKSYDARASLHRPEGPALASEVLRLHREGLTAQDISVALREPLAAVINLIAGATT
jgi:hypothetical protein